MDKGGSRLLAILTMSFPGIYFVE